MNIKNVIVKTVAVLVVGMASVTCADTPTITDVTAKQRYPWNGKVDILYTLKGDMQADISPDSVLALVLTATNRTTGAYYEAIPDCVSGDTGTAGGTHHVVWDLNAQGLGFESSDVVFSVAYVKYPRRYCVIDLSAGANADYYPVSYMTNPPSGGFNVDEYKTTKLVLKRMDAGTFVLGEDQANETHRVTLTKPFFCGIFEVTQKQYELVTGSKPSASYGEGDTYPVYYVSYDMIRGSMSGSMWPSSSAVDDSSFVGKLRNRTGLNFDIPTEAQWEYACRAGTTTKYNYGDSSNENYMWYSSRYMTYPVGTADANAWGLYDVHGNVWEWCLDWFASSLEYGTDPLGATTGSERIVRGGGFNSQEYECTSSYRGKFSSSRDYKSCGFRLVRTISDIESEVGLGATPGSTWFEMLCAGDSASVAIDSRVNVDHVLDAVVLPWDASWIGGDAGGTIVIADNGTEVKRTTGKGEFAYAFANGGRHELTYTTYIGALAQDEVYAATYYSRWKYEELDGGVVITESTQNTGNLTIPSVIDGKQVVGIASSVFSGCSGLTSVSIPDGVTSIGERAFYGCSGLASVTVPDSVTIIGGDAFGGTPFYDNLPDGLVVLGKVAYRMKGECPNAVAIPEGVASISDGAFFGCSGLMSVIIPDGVMIVGRTAFAGCGNIRSASVPSGLKLEGLQCGMIQARFDAANDFSSSILDSDTRANVSGVLMGYACATASSSPVFSDPIYGGSYQWSDYTTFGYYGYMYMVAGRTYVFGKYFDDSAYVKVDGTIVLRNINCEDFATGSYIPSTTGWHELEVRVADDGRADKGPYGAFSGASPSYWSANLGVGWRDDGITDALPESGWHKLMDDGSGSLLRTELDCCKMSLLFPDAYDKLESVTIVGTPSEVPVEAFAGCASLREIDIPTSVTNIGASAFAGCDSLQTVDIPSSVIGVGANAFSGCSSIADVTIPQCVCSQRLSAVFPDAYTSITNVVVCEGTKTIGTHAFDGCVELQSVSIPDSLASIDSYAFYGCSGLTSLTIPAGFATKVGSYAFYGCSGLRSVTIPQSVYASEMSSVFPSAYQAITNIVICDGATSISSYAFRGCSALKSLTVPNSVTSISSGAFSGCGALESLTVPFVGASRNATGSSALLGYIFGSSSYLGGVATTQTYYYSGSLSESSATLYIPGSLWSVTITDSSNVGDGAFSGCSGLVDVEFPDSVTNIGSRAFSGCSGLSSISIPDSVRSVGAYAFAGCDDHIDIETIPNVQILDGWVLGCFGTVSGTLDLSEVRGIAASAFHGCDNITDIQFGNGMLAIGANAFSGCNGLTSVVVPDSVLYIGEGAFGWCRYLKDISLPFIGSCRGNAGTADSLFGWVFGSKGYQTGPSSYTYYNGYATAVEQFYDSSSSKTYYIPNALVKVSITDESNVGFGAFGSCTNLVDVVLPSGVDSIGGYAFTGCSGLKRLRMEGNAPLVGVYAFQGVNESCCARVHDASTGWGVDIPGVWKGIGIRYIEEAVTSVAAPVISPCDGTVFSESSCTVTISCETDGAEIYYSQSGKTPKVSEANRYKGPFSITNTATIKAVAVYDDGATTLKSDYATAVITKRTLTLGEAASADAATAALEWSTGGNGRWSPEFDETAASGLSARSGAISDGRLTWISTSVSGPGTLVFKWKTNCEWDDSGDATWDHLAVLTNGADGAWIEVARIDGNTPWSDMTITFVGKGVNSVRWEYSKDESDRDGEDCAWVSGVAWAPAGGGADVTVDAGGGKSVTIPSAWLDGHAVAIAGHGGDREAYAKSTAANGRKVWECYLLGLDPEDEESDFKITSFQMNPDGTVDLNSITIDPPKAEWNVQGVTPVLKGKATLDGEGEWQPVTEENKAGMRFFRVEVVLP